MGNRGYRVPHTPGGLWELSSTPLSTTGSCIFPHMLGGNGGCLCGKKKSRKVVNWSERRGMAPIGHTPPSLLPQSPLLPSLYYPHNPNSQFLKEFHTSVSTRKAENGGVPCVFGSSSPLLPHLGCFLQWGEGGEMWPHALGILPTVGGLAGIGAPSQAVTQTAGYSCSGQF